MDRGESLIPILSERYRVQQHTVRYGRSFLESGYRTSDSIPMVFWFLDVISPNRRPSSQDDIAVLNSAIDWISTCGNKPERDLIEYFASALFREGVAGFRALLRQHCPAHDPDNLFPDITDFLCEYAQLFVKVSVPTHGVDLIKQQWIRENGVLSVLVESEHWLTSRWLNRVNSVLISWTALTAEPVQIGDLVVHELNNSESLFEEGAAMRHCIASYASVCSSGDSFVFSIREKNNGKRRSTLYIGLDENYEFEVLEHRAFANKVPDPECYWAAQQLISRLSTEETIYDHHRPCHSVYSTSRAGDF